MDEPSPDNPVFAWNGILFQPPPRWELASQRLRKGVTCISMEDENARRLELEWLRPKNPPAAEQARIRFDHLTRDLAGAALDFHEIPGLPGGWNAFRYAMPERGTLILAYFTPEQPGDPMGFLRLHFDARCREAPTETLRALVRSFRVQRGPLRLWCFYDVSFRLDPAFHLIATSLQAGRKMLLFERGLRRLFLWHFSLADLILEKQSAAAWCAEFLAGFRPLRALRFQADGGRLVAVRKRLHLFGHYEEIGRWCFRYVIGCRHLPAKNQIALWVYHCRSRRDEQGFADAFALPGEAAGSTTAALAHPSDKP